MGEGRIYWTAPESQYYAEPKRLAQHGYLTAAKQPGRTHERTHYRLTDQGREALRALAGHARARFGRMQNEPVVRLLGAEYAERGVLLKSLEALRTELDELEAGLQSPRDARGRPAAPRHGPAAQPARSRSGSSTRTGAWLDEVEARAVKALCSPFRAYRRFGRLTARLRSPLSEGGQPAHAWASSHISPASVAVTWRSISARPTRSSTCAAAASCSASRAWSRSTPAPARSTPSGSRPSACSAAPRGRSAPSGR